LASVNLFDANFLYFWLFIFRSGLQNDTLRVEWEVKPRPLTFALIVCFVVSFVSRSTVMPSY